MSPPTPPNDFVLRELVAGDRAAWVAARCALWPDCPADQAEAEIQIITQDSNQIAYGVFDGDELIGLAEYSLHPHAIGCGPGPVAYLEGWWVAETARRKRVGSMLVDAGMAWGRHMGCREMASDTWVDNTVSDQAHRALGFDAVEQLIHYRRLIEE